MSAANEEVVRRFYEKMCNARQNDLAAELFTSDHEVHDPQVPTGDGPEAMAATVAVYQQGVEAHWKIEDIFSAGDKVAVRWTGSGKHISELNGLPPTGKPVKVEAISIHRIADGKIAETWQVWDTLGFMQQLGVIPQS